MGNSMVRDRIQGVGSGALLGDSAKQGIPEPGPAPMTKQHHFAALLDACPQNRFASFASCDETCVRQSERVTPTLTAP